MATTTENKVTYGSSKAWYALATFDETDKVTYGTPKMIENLQSFSISETTNPTDVNADNHTIARLNVTKSATITAVFTVISDAVKQDILNHVADSTGHDVEITNAKTKYFAFGVQVEGDIHANRRVWYLCTAQLGDGSYKSTGDSVEVNSKTLTITALSKTVGDMDVLAKTFKSTDSDYATVLTAAPTLPTFTA